MRSHLPKRKWAAKHGLSIYPINSERCGVEKREKTPITNAAVAASSISQRKVIVFSKFGSLPLAYPMGKAPVSDHVYTWSF